MLYQYLGVVFGFIRSLGDFHVNLPPFLDDDIDHLFVDEDILCLPRNLRESGEQL